MKTVIKRISLSVMLGLMIVQGVHAYTEAQIQSFVQRYNQLESLKKQLKTQQDNLSQLNNSSYLRSARPYGIEDANNGISSISQQIAQLKPLTSAELAASQATIKAQATKAAEEAEIKAEEDEDGGRMEERYGRWERRRG